MPELSAEIGQQIAESGAHVRRGEQQVLGASAGATSSQVSGVDTVGRGPARGE